MALLLQPPHHCLLPALLQPPLHVPLDLLHEHSCLPDLLQRLLMFFHLAQDRRLVQVGRHDVILLLVPALPHQRLLQVDRIAHRLQGHHEVPVLLEDAGQVVEGKDAQLGEHGGVGEMARHLRQHHHVHCLRDELHVAALLPVLDVLHRQPIHLLHESPHLLPHAEPRRPHRPAPLGHQQCQVDQFLLAEDALDRVHLIPLAEFAHHRPDVGQDLLVADVVVFHQLHFSALRNHSIISSMGMGEFREGSKLSGYESQPCLFLHCTHSFFLSALMIIAGLTLQISQGFLICASVSQASFFSVLGGTGCLRSALSAWASLEEAEGCCEGSILSFMWEGAGGCFCREAVRWSPCRQLLQRVQLRKDLSKVCAQHILQIRLLLSVVFSSVPSSSSRMQHRQHCTNFPRGSRVTAGSLQFYTLISTEFLESAFMLASFPAPFLPSESSISNALNLLTMESSSEGSSSSICPPKGFIFSDLISLMREAGLVSWGLRARLCSMRVWLAEHWWHMGNSRQCELSLKERTCPQLRQRWKNSSNCFLSSYLKQQSQNFIPPCSSKSMLGLNLNPQLMQQSERNASTSSRSLKWPHRISRMKGGSPERKCGRKAWATQRGQQCSPQISSLKASSERSLRLQIRHCVSLTSLHSAFRQIGQWEGLHRLHSSRLLSQQEKRGANSLRTVLQLAQCFTRLMDIQYRS